MKYTPLENVQKYFNVRCPNLEYKQIHVYFLYNKKPQIT